MKVLTQPEHENNNHIYIYTPPKICRVMPQVGKSKKDTKEDSKSGERNYNPSKYGPSTHPTQSCPHPRPETQRDPPRSQGRRYQSRSPPDRPSEMQDPPQSVLQASL